MFMHDMIELSKVQAGEGMCHKQGLKWDATGHYGIAAFYWQPSEIHIFSEIVIK